MPLTVVESSLARMLLTRLRDRSTPPEQFRACASAISTILAVNAASTLPVTAHRVTTPLEETDGCRLSTPLVVMPVLRAGLGMLGAVQDLLPHADVAYIGLERDEETALAHAYYYKAPPLAGATVWVLDPMLATGGSADMAVTRAYEAGAQEVTLICIVAAPEGVALLCERHPEMNIISAALDRELDARKYILPGLGDFGDRLFGT